MWLKALGKKGWGAAMVLGLAWALLGCAGDPQGSAERLTKAVIQAQDRGELTTYRHALPPRALLQSHFDCGRQDKLVGALQIRHEDLAAEFQALRSAGFRMKLNAYREKRELGLEKADLFRGCTVLKPVRVVEAEVLWSRARHAQVEPVREVWRFLQFEADGPWYLGDF